MTTEQRMYELFLDELDEQEREINNDLLLCQAAFNEREFILKKQYFELEKQKKEITRLNKTIETVMKDCQGFNRARLEAIEYNREVEQHVRNLFTALGTEIVRSEILTRLNKPKC